MYHVMMQNGNPRWSTCTQLDECTIPAYYHSPTGHRDPATLYSHFTGEEPPPAPIQKGNSSEREVNDNAKDAPQVESQSPFALGKSLLNALLGANDGARTGGELRYQLESIPQGSDISEHLPLLAYADSYINSPEYFMDSARHDPSGVKRYTRSVEYAVFLSHLGDSAETDKYGSKDTLRDLYRQIQGDYVGIPLLEDIDGRALGGRKLITTVCSDRQWDPREALKLRPENVLISLREAAFVYWVSLSVGKDSSTPPLDLGATPFQPYWKGSSELRVARSSEQKLLYLFWFAMSMARGHHLSVSRKGNKFSVYVPRQGGKQNDRLPKYGRTSSSEPTDMSTRQYARAYFSYSDALTAFMKLPAAERSDWTLEHRIIDMSDVVVPPSLMHSPLGLQQGIIFDDVDPTYHKTFSVFGALSRDVAAFQGVVRDQRFAAGFPDKKKVHESMVNKSQKLRTELARKKR